MTMPADYQQFCGPRAVAALLGIHPARAATLLWRVQAFRGRITAPSTSSSDALAVLVSQGCSVAEFGSSRAATLAELRGHDELAAELLEDLRRGAQDAAQGRRDPATPPDPAPPVSAEVERRLAAIAQELEGRDLVTLREFIAAVPAADWYVAAGASAEFGQLVWHAIALRDGQVIAGDYPDLRTYGSAAVMAAWRITLPREEPSP